MAADAVTIRSNPSVGPPRERVHAGQPHEPTERRRPTGRFGESDAGVHPAQQATVGEAELHLGRHLVFGQNIFAGRRGDSSLTPVPNPPEERAFYRVEEEFVNAIRGTEQVSMLTFDAGLHYMDFTEAVYRSSQTGTAVHLPL